jgi:hypothetical protein
MDHLNDEFLNSVASINENQAGYNLLAELNNKCSKKIFLLELSELCNIRKYFEEIITYINDEYRSFELHKFELDTNGNMKKEKLFSVSGSSLRNSAIVNKAREITEKNKSYILVKTNESIVLMNNGDLDTNFNNKIAEKMELEKLEKSKKSLDDLSYVFDKYRLNRRHYNFEYIANGKVKNDVSEQKLRNHLLNFLIQTTNLIILPELCTSYEKDEESVDIALIDRNERVVIIEVKYFVERGFFQDESKYKYSYVRFKHGYNQLNKYCIDLTKGNYKLHSAFLYMFYAHSKSKEEILVKAKEYFDSEKSNFSESFKNHYKETICDDMVNTLNI